MVLRFYGTEFLTTLRTCCIRWSPQRKRALGSKSEADMFCVCILAFFRNSLKEKNQVREESLRTYLQPRMYPSFDPSAFCNLNRKYQPYAWITTLSAFICCWNRNPKTICRPCVCVCVYVCAGCVYVCCAWDCFLLPPHILTACWLTEDWFTPHYSLGLSWELLLPINFVIHLQ